MESEGLPITDHHLAYVISPDGTRIGYRKFGKGPSLLFLHGGGFASQHYLELAERLASSYTVIMPVARGRGLTGPFGVGHGMRQEVEDIGAIVTETGAVIVFGHSRGGLVALEAGLCLPFQKIAV